MNAFRHSDRPEPSPADEPLARLLAQIASGREAALAELYDAFGAWVYGLALRIAGDAATAEEVTLDVFHQAWSQARQFDPTRGTAQAWLLRMARNRAIDRLRSRRAAEHKRAPLAAASDTADPRPEPAVLLALADRGARVRRALAGLDAGQQRVIELAFFDGLSHGRIAKQLDLPLGTVKTRIRLGIRRLAETLAREDDA